MVAAKPPIHQRNTVPALLALLALLACCLPASSCSLRHMALKETGAMLTEGMVALNQEPDFDLARESLPGSLKTVEVLLVSDPENRDLLFVLAQGYAAYAFLVVEDAIDLADAAGDLERVKLEKARAGAFYLRAQGYALRGLNREELTAAMASEDPEPLRKSLTSLEKADAPLLFWLTYAWAGRINLDQSNPARIAELSRIGVLLNRVLALDPSYYQGLPQLMAGVFYAGRPPMFGGDLPKGRGFLEAGIRQSQGKFLLGKFLLARYYAVQAQDRALFCSQLLEIIQADPALLPEQGLMNGVTRRWAQRWETRAGSLFEAAGEAGCQPAPSAVPAGKVEEDDGMLQ